MNKSKVTSTKDRSVFVGNIPYDVTEEQLAEIFSEVGPVLNFRLLTDRETGKAKGYGFCEYADGAMALNAMRYINGHEVNGRNLRVDFADGGDKDKSGVHSGISGEQKCKYTSGHFKSGEDAIKALDRALSKVGPVGLVDFLTEFQAFATKTPEHTKAILTHHPALSHAMVSIFELFDIPLLSKPPPQSQPSRAGGGSQRPQQSSGSHYGPSNPTSGNGGGNHYGPPPVSIPAPQQHIPHQRISPANSNHHHHQHHPYAHHQPQSQPPPHHHYQPPSSYPQQHPNVNMNHPANPPPIGGGGILGSAPVDPRQRRSAAVLGASPPLTSAQPIIEPSRDPRRRRAAAASAFANNANPPALANDPESELKMLAENMTMEKLEQLAPDERELLLNYMQQLGLPTPTSN